jgi:hypothetical protein
LSAVQLEESAQSASSAQQLLDRVLLQVLVARSHTSTVQRSESSQAAFEGQQSGFAAWVQALSVQTSVVHRLASSHSASDVQQPAIPFVLQVPLPTSHFSTVQAFPSLVQSVSTVQQFGLSV